MNSPVARRALLVRATASAIALALPRAVGAQTRVCPTCYGRGDWIDPRTGRIQACPTCHGSGQVPSRERRP